MNDYDGTNIKENMYEKLDFWVMVILIIISFIFFIWYNNHTIAQCNSYWVKQIGECICPLK